MSTQQTKPANRHPHKQTERPPAQQLPQNCAQLMKVIKTQSLEAGAVLYSLSLSPQGIIVFEALEEMNIVQLELLIFRMGLLEDREQFPQVNPKKLAKLIQEFRKKLERKYEKQWKLNSDREGIVPMRVKQEYSSDYKQQHGIDDDRVSEPIIEIKKRSLKRQKYPLPSTTLRKQQNPIKLHDSQQLQSAPLFKPLNGLYSLTESTPIFFNQPEHPSYPQLQQDWQPTPKTPRPPPSCLTDTLIYCCSLLVKPDSITQKQQRKQDEPPLKPFWPHSNEFGVTVRAYRDAQRYGKEEQP